MSLSPSGCSFVWRDKETFQGEMTFDQGQEPRVEFELAEIRRRGVWEEVVVERV